nr:hypothetical protein [uncultured bacterium]
MGMALLALGAPVLGQESTSTPEATAMAGEQVVINVPGITPEGVEYDATGQRFLIGSLTDGKIRQVTDDGMVSTFVEDADNVSTTGLQVDAVRNRLLVASTDAVVFSDPSAKGKAALAAYDLSSGKRLFYVDLAAIASDGRNFANDVAIDADGNAYVTNSMTPVIYKVDTEGKASVFARDDRFAGTPIGLNGIDFDPDGYLLVSAQGKSKVYKIPVQDPSIITEVKLSEPFGADGMALAEDGTLYAVAMTGQGDSAKQEVLAVTSADGWASGTIAARLATDGNASTLAIRDGAPWYIEDYVSNPQATQYEIVHAMLEAG